MAEAVLFLRNSLAITLKNLLAIICEWGKIPRVDTLLCCQSGGSGDYADVVSGARYGDGANPAHVH